MAKLRCRACLGTYNDTSSDGTRYFHACAPRRNPAFFAQYNVAADGSLISKGTVDPEIRESIPHPRARDENVTVDVTGQSVPKSDGDGKDTL